MAPLPMRVAVYGAGGIGAFYGTRLSDGGADVHLIARGAHLDAIRERGLTVETADEAKTYDLPATDDPASIGPVDIVLFCVKSYDTEAAAARLEPLLRPDTAVISLQNGIDNEDRIAAAIGPQHVVGGAAYIMAAVSKPGVVTASGPRSIVVGEMAGGPPSPRLEAFIEVARRGGFGAIAAADIRVAKWEKYTLLVAFSAMTAAVRLPVGPIARSPAAAAMLRSIMTEAWTVGRASGVALADDLVDRQYALLTAQEEDGVTSLYNDMTTGHRMEVEALQGTLIRMGRSVGIPTPWTEAAYAILQPWAMRNESR